MDRRSFFIGGLACASLAKRLPAEAAPVLRPEDFGARGDGKSNDTGAFASLSAVVQRAGGGTIRLATGRTYIVGEQFRSRDRPFTPQPLLSFQNLHQPLTILGNGACLRAAADLRFGAFDPANGRPVFRDTPNLRDSDRTSPYLAMILVRGSLAPVAISDVELDGNVDELIVGGPWGDSGFQVPGSGLALYDNLAEETVSNLFSHHHPLDGIIIDGARNRAARSRLSGLVCEGNGRQGMSLVGGVAYEFHDCVFSRTGRSRIRSAPGAGVDIEAENNKSIRDISFTACKFIDNAGPGMVAEGGNSADVSFQDCEFVGTSAWAAQPNRPHFRFDRCRFAGTVVQAYASKTASAACKFHQCRFTDDPRLSPTGKVFVAGKAGNGIVNLGRSDNVLFERCRFELSHEGVLPWSWRAIYQDCIMRQTASTPAMTKGKYVGQTDIKGPVDLYGSMIVGTVILNGKVVPRGPVGADVAPW